MLLGRTRESFKCAQNVPNLITVLEIQQKQNYSATLATAKTQRQLKRARKIAEKHAEKARKEKEFQSLLKRKSTPFLNSLVTPKKLEFLQGTSSSDKAAAKQQSQDQKESSREVTYNLGTLRKQFKNSNLFQYGIQQEEKTIIEKQMQSDAKQKLLFPNDMTMKKKFELFENILNLKNANSKELLRWNIQKAVEFFRRGERDTGSPEVQAGVLTVKIRNLERHLLNHHKDHHTRRDFIQLKQQRAKMLKYLKRVSLERYAKCLNQLGLLPEEVEHEICHIKRVTEPQEYLV